MRESREPAPRMGRVSFVQTARGGKLFPGLFSNLAAYNLLTNSSV